MPGMKARKKASTPHNPGIFDAECREQNRQRHRHEEVVHGPYAEVK